MTNDGFWQQGEVQTGRASARPQFPHDGYQQTVLSPPDVLEVRLRLGFIRADHHGRWQLEVIDPRSRELLAMYSRPHFVLSQLDESLADAGNRLGILLADYLDPDPFP